MDRYRDRRSPPRHSYGRGPPPSGDSYVPGGRGGRPRSRSPPPYRRRSRSPPPPPRMNDRWTPRTRSPPPGRYGPRDSFAPRDGRARSPRPAYGSADDRYRSAPRSPPMRRSREGSPLGGRARSPPPSKSRRIGSPPPRDYDRPPRSPPRRQYSPPRDRGGYRPRSRSPPPRRDDSYSGGNSWRRRSPTPRSTGADSAAISRRSSPRPADRRRLDIPDREPNPTSTRSPRPASPRNQPQALTEQQTDKSNNTRTPRDSATDDDRARDRDRAPATPHAPPTGPSAAAQQPAPPPTGPSNRPPSTPAHPHRSSAVPYRGRGSDFRRGSWTTSNPPSGPSGRGRGSDPYDARGRPAHSPGGAPYRGSSSGNNNNSGPSGAPSSSRTFPLTRRFNVAAELASLPRVKAEGERLPPLVDGARAARLEDEAARLRRVIDEKRGVARRGLREYAALERASRAAAERSAAAEEELRALVGEGATGAAF